MNIVLGLGNPGAVYAGTRHNIGFMVADRLAAEAGARFPEHPSREFQAWMVEISDGGPVLAKPATFMNRSGLAAARLAVDREVEAGDMIVVYDDVNLPYGRIRVRPQGSAGGHNGVQSLVEELGTDSFPRVRLGVLGAGRGDIALADYVLSEFDREERGRLDGFIDRGAAAVQAILASGIAAAMNEFNRPPLDPETEEIHPDR